MLTLLSFLAGTALATDFELRVTEKDPTYLCSQHLSEMVVPANSTSRLHIVTDPTSVFWASLGPNSPLKFEAVSGFAHIPGVDPIIQDPGSKSVWTFFKDQSGLKSTRTFVIEVTNPSNKPTSVLLMVGLTEMSLALTLGSIDPSVCFQRTSWQP